MLIGVHYKYDLPFVWNETGLHWENRSLCYSNVSTRSAAKTNSRSWEHALWRNYTAETLCERPVLQKRFVKKSNWIFRNLEKRMYNINFLSNIFQSGVINVKLCSLLIKTKHISFIYHKNGISYSIFSNALHFFKCPTASQQERAFKLNPVAWELSYFKTLYNKG
jgi:hypothetical protein